MAMKMSLAYQGKETPKEEKEEGETSRRKKEKESNKRNMSYHVRPIKNGFIKKTSWEEGEGNNIRYKDEEEYHKDDPFA